MLKVNIDDSVSGTFYPLVQTDKGVGKWIVMEQSEQKDTKDDIVCHTICVSEPAVKALKKGKAKKAWVKAEKAAADLDYLKILKQDANKDAADAEDIDKAYHASFTKLLMELGKKKPVMGAIEFKKKIIFVSYCSDDLKAAKKMVFANIREPVKKSLDINKNIQATSPGELDLACFTKACE